MTPPTEGDDMDSAALDEAALTAAQRAVQDILIEFRDERLSLLGCANGFVVREPDGRESSMIRLGTRDGLAIGISAYLEALKVAADGE